VTWHPCAGGSYVVHSGTSVSYLGVGYKCPATAVSKAVG
jgi:hypothetical protein